MPGGGDMRLIRDMLSSAAASWSSWKDYGESGWGGGGGVWGGVEVYEEEWRCLRKVKK